MACEGCVSAVVDSASGAVCRGAGTECARVVIACVSARVPIRTAVQVSARRNQIGRGGPNAGAIARPIRYAGVAQ